MGTVVVFGTIAMFVYPFLYSHGFLDMSEKAYGMFVGGTLHEVAHAVAAGQAISIDAGNTAVIVKMLRVIAIAPVICLGFWLNRFPEKTEEESRVPSYGSYNFSSFRGSPSCSSRASASTRSASSPKQAVSHQFAGYLHAHHGHVRPRHGNQPRKRSAWSAPSLSSSRACSPCGSSAAI